LQVSLSGRIFLMISSLHAYNIIVINRVGAVPNEVNSIYEFFRHSG
jgi:hypothetical protein